MRVLSQYCCCLTEGASYQSGKLGVMITMKYERWRQFQRDALGCSVLRNQSFFTNALTSLGRPPVATAWVHFYCTSVAMTSEDPGGRMTDAVALPQNVPCCWENRTSLVSVNVKKLKDVLPKNNKNVDNSFLYIINLKKLK